MPEAETRRATAGGRISDGERSFVGHFKRKIRGNFQNNFRGISGNFSKRY